jgi:hypothetical protein
MPDPYQVFEAPEVPPAAKRGGGRGGAVRPLLWLVLVISAAANVVASTTDHVFVGAAFGLVALACATALVVHHYRNRRR